MNAARTITVRIGARSIVVEYERSLADGGGSPLINITSAKRGATTLMGRGWSHGPAMRACALACGLADEDALEARLYDAIDDDLRDAAETADAS